MRKIAHAPQHAGKDDETTRFAEQGWNGGRSLCVESRRDFGDEQEQQYDGHEAEELRQIAQASIRLDVRSANAGDEGAVLVLGGLSVAPRVRVFGGHLFIRRVGQSPMFHVSLLPVRRSTVLGNRAYRYE